MEKLQLLYLSYNLLTQIPENLPKNILELRIHDNKISRIQKEAFKGMQSLHVLGTDINLHVLINFTAHPCTLQHFTPPENGLNLLTQVHMSVLYVPLFTT